MAFEELAKAAGMKYAHKFRQSKSPQAVDETSQAAAASQASGNQTVANEDHVEGFSRLDIGHGAPRAPRAMLEKVGTCSVCLPSLKR